MASLVRQLVLATAAVAFLCCHTAVAEQEAQSSSAPTVFRTTVRRVIVDVIVTDKKGRTVPGLSQRDFAVADNGASQQVLSFDAVGFDAHMDYLPPTLPPEPVNTFVNLPTEPEKGPLYVLLYDLVNMASTSDQSLARKELIKFIEEKPEGSRFALFMFSDGLHLVQGFTSDKKLLLAAIDPNHSQAHVPKIFLMGPNFGQGDAPTAVWILSKLASFLQGMPGRKNLIWFSGGFPLALYPDEKDNLQYYQEVKQTIDLLARTQIAVYPVDTRGVAIENAHAPSGDAGDEGAITSDSREKSAPSATTPSPGSQPAGGGGQGYSLLSASYLAEDEIARVTGGRAFYSTNDLKGALEHATEDGGSYYSLSYAPSTRDYDGKLHTISVQLADKGYTLSYRHAYYAVEPKPSLPNSARTEAVASASVALDQQVPRRAEGDLLSTYMEHGAPLIHSLIFGAHIDCIGAPAMGTTAQMADLAQQTIFLRTRRKATSLKPLAPVKLQQYTIDYTVMAHQLHRPANDAAIDLEIAAAAYDADGNLLNAAVNQARRDGSTSSEGQAKAYRAEQVLFVPLHAATIRLAVHDRSTDRIGAMEVKLPLAPEPPNQASARTTPNQ